ncbi:MAG: dihydrolipoyl dehydrogenase [Sedimentibacter sp.]|uniref:dihydrolipoyl dehydrogenase n=1 Tax=Sedimentibacter sp. TaxID=1960295 RepID=UPI0029813D36|nr:dihydrolipoyl dehydrogenase [Sedimentibacter sp.]MDW5300038.1 dihydrolipoyl dehydrogenase [Sedimentibacter sp.]
MKIAIIGGGPGGYVAAIRAAQLGADVTLIERKHIGGTCLNKGCIPTKVLLHTTEQLEVINKDYKEIGINVSNVEISWKQLQKRKEKVVRKLVGGVDVLLKNNKVTKIMGEGSFISNNQIAVKVTDGTETTVDFDYAIISTGSKPVIIPLPGVNLPGVITSDEALSLQEIPKSLVVIGGGVIGAEFAAVYSALGCKVTIIEMLSNIVANMDKDIVQPLKDKFIKNGVEIYTDTKVVSISESSEGLSVNTSSQAGDKSFVAEKVLLSIGRKPVTDNMGLENVGVKTERNAIVVNKNMQTNIDNIYAIGDCNGGVMLAHVASAEGIVAVEAIMNKKPNMDFKTIPYCVYTRPELAGVGLTEEQAKAKGYDIKVGVFPMYINGKAMIEGNTDGVVKYIVDAATKEVLGLHMVGPRATDLIVEGALAIRLEATIDEIISTIHAHPTVGESLQEAAHAVYGNAIHIPI